MACNGRHVQALPQTGWRCYPWDLVHRCCDPRRSYVDLQVFMSPPLGAGGIMFWGCPSIYLSVRSLKYNLSTCTWVHWSIRPTVTLLQHVHPSACPSVHPERFLGICQRTHGCNGLKFCMLMYLGHLQNWLDYGHGLLILLLLVPRRLSEMGQIWGFRVFSQKHMEGMAWNFACCCVLVTLRLIRLWLWSVDFFF